MKRLTAKRRSTHVTAVAAALLVLGGGTAAIATDGGDRGPVAESAKKKKDRRVGAYRGTTEEGGTVSFRITKKQMVVGFTMPNVPVQCRIYEQGNPPPYPKGTFTINAPPMRLQVGPEGGPQFFYEDPPDESRAFQGIHVDGKGAPGGGMKGNAAMASWNGPATQSGTEQCNTAFVDWSANKIGGKKKK